ncbi:hypothetical protein D6783_02725 [Candidatus Woesearchaeota archaeon]|nr:MAG: hypothetical protein D6783_02725 [Candidatus Woesearchaeota archaeon]
MTNQPTRAWDLLKPNKNEQALLDEATKLGFKNVGFLYTTLHDLRAAQARTNVPATQQRTRPPNTVQRILLTEKTNPPRIPGVELLAPTTRHAAEHPAIHYLYRAEIHPAKDKTHHPTTHLNQVIATILKEKNKHYLFDWSLILQEHDPHRRATILGRMLHNAKLLKKYRVKTSIITLADLPQKLLTPRDLKAIQHLLGLD